MNYEKIREYGKTVPRFVNVTTKLPRHEYDKIFEICTQSRLNMGETVRALLLYAIQVLEAEDVAAPSEEVSGDE